MVPSERDKQWNVLHFLENSLNLQNHSKGYPFSPNMAEFSASADSGERGGREAQINSPKTVSKRLWKKAEGEGQRAYKWAYYKSSNTWKERERYSRMGKKAETENKKMRKFTLEGNYFWMERERPLWREERLLDGAERCIAIAASSIHFPPQFSFHGWMPRRELPMSSNEKCPCQLFSRQACSLNYLWNSNSWKL